MTTVQVKYEMRTPSEFAIDRKAYFFQALEQIAWIDKSGMFDRLNFCEHHGTKDGYLPSPLIMMASAAAITKTLRLQGNMVLPFYDPIRLAEDIAIIDIVSAGRAEIVAIGGYLESEFDLFGKNMKERGAEVEESINVLRRAWRGERFAYHGRNIYVSPQPLQQPSPPIYMGGSSAPAARRAARIADGFMPTSALVYRYYEEECEKLGRTPRNIGKIGPAFIHVSRDPERDWAHIAPHALNQANMYVRWQSQGKGHDLFKHASDSAALKATGNFAVLTPDECLELARSLGNDGVLSLDPLMGGMSARLGWESLELFASDVAPRLNELTADEIRPFFSCTERCEVS